MTCDARLNVCWAGGSPRPHGHRTGLPRPLTRRTGKYRQLWQWLQDQGRDEIRLTFADVEQVLGMPLPQSARRHPTHWYGYEGTALGRAIRDAGWRASQVNLTDETVLFIRDEAQNAGEDGVGKRALN